MLQDKAFSLPPKIGEKMTYFVLGETKTVRTWRHYVLRFFTGTFLSYPPTTSFDTGSRPICWTSMSRKLFFWKSTCLAGLPPPHQNPSHSFSEITAESRQERERNHEEKEVMRSRWTTFRRPGSGSDHNWLWELGQVILSLRTTLSSNYTLFICDMGMVADPTSWVLLRVEWGDAFQVLIYCLAYWKC